MSLKSLNLLIIGILCVCKICFGNEIENYAASPCLCLTPNCVRAAASILDKIDESISPCEDFYSFACNQYIRNTIIPEDKSYVDSFSVVRDSLQNQLQTIITAPIDKEDIAPFKMMKKLYAACMNKDLVEKLELLPIQNIMREMGGWPVVEGNNWTDVSWTWQKAAVDCREHGYSTDYVVDFSVGADLKNSSMRIVDIDQPDLGLSQAFLLKGIENPVVNAYHKFQVDMAVLYGAERKRAEDEMKEALDFEIELAKISLPNEKRRNASAIYHPITIKNLQKKYPYNNWLKYFNDLLPQESQVNEDETVIIYDLGFFDKFDNLIKSTPKRAIANYVMWRVAAESTNYLTDKLRERQQEYAAALIGQTTQEPRWKECIDVVSSNFQIATAALYVRKYFNHASKEVALEMVNSIKREFEEILKNAPWIDEITRERALYKVHKMATHIGFPDELADDKLIIEYYKNVDVDEEKYLESILSIKKAENDRNLAKLRKPTKGDWEIHAKSAVVNAAYSPLTNSIRFPAGILQGVFFNANRPKFMNYAAIGVIIGHEITHGFDDQGRQFDAYGNLADWWEKKETADEFIERAQCIIEQYGNFTEDLSNLNVNGINTQGENIADLGGYRQAYLAYQEYSKKHGSEAMMPGLKYSTNQLFWISAAQTWCSRFTPEAMKKRILTGIHSPPQFRVLGPLTNMKEFSKDFQCPETSKMNPKQKCQIW